MKSADSQLEGDLLAFPACVLSPCGFLLLCHIEKRRFDILRPLQKNKKYGLVYSFFFDGFRRTESESAGGDPHPLFRLHLFLPCECVRASACNNYAVEIARIR